MNQTIQLTDDLLEAALVARMRHAPSQALFDRIASATARTPQARAPHRWLRGGPRVAVGTGMPALVSVAATAIAVVLLFTVLRATPPEPGASPTPTPAETRVSVPTPEARLFGDSSGLRIRLGAGAAPIDVIAAFDSIWTADSRAGEVSRVDPVSFERIARVPVSGEPAWFVVADNALWVTDQTSGIVRIEPSTSTASAAIGGASPCGAPVLAGGDIWAWACDDDLYVRIDPVANAVVDRIPAQGHRWLAAVGGQLITVGSDGLAILDPRTRSFTRIGAGAGAGGRLLGSDGASLWVALNQAVERVDATDGRVIASLPYLGAQAMAFAGDHAWLTVDNRGVLKIDLATSSVVQTIPLLPSPQVPLEAAGALWVTDFNNSDLWRIQP